MRLRGTTKNPGEITGYSVGLASHTNRDGRVIWYGGGKLAADLTPPKLRQRWNPRNAPAQLSCLHRITAEEQNAAYEHAAREARAATAHIRRCSASDPGRGADAARATADVLRIAARVLRDPALRRAADAYDRAARAPYGRVPRCTYPGDRLRLLARRLADLGLTADSGCTGDLAVSLAMLTTAVADLRAAQHRPAQAAAARRAAEYLREAVTNRRTSHGPAEVRVRASDVARMVSQPDSRCPGKPARTATHSAEHLESGPPRAGRDRRQVSVRSLARALWGVALRPDFCHLITACLDDKLTTMIFRPAPRSGNWPVTCGNWWAVQDLNL